MGDNRLLCIDDESAICDIITAAASHCDYDVIATTTSKEFKAAFNDIKPSLVMLDLNLNGEDGIQLLHFLHSQNYEDPIILLSGYDEKVLSTAKLLGLSLGLAVSCTMHKPVKLEELSQILKAYKSSNVPITKDRLNEAIAKKEFVVYFQPQISLRNGELIGIEALVRWQPPHQALIYPDEFIPLVEQANIIKPFTDLVIEETFRQVNIWQSAGQDLKVSVNISAKYLDNWEIPEQIAKFTKEFNLQPERVFLEITESALLDKTKLAMEVLTRLRIKGFNLSMDDFGTGYSSMLSLHQMPFNQMKLDRTFILKIESDPTLQILVRNLINLFKELKVETVAEGIETESALTLLRDYACDIGQGYYIGRPLSAEHFETWLAAYVSPFKN